MAKQSNNNTKGGKLAALSLKEFDIDFLLSKAADYNPRIITDEEKAGLKISIKKFGYVNNVIYNEKLQTLVSGHQRLTELKEVGYQRVQAHVVKLDLASEKALNVAMNSSTITGEFTKDLNMILEDILSSDPEFYDLASLGKLKIDEEATSILDEDGETGVEVDVPDMDLLPYEHYDAVLVVFKSTSDWLYLSTALGLDDKKIISAPMVENKKVGVVRAVDAAKIVALLEGKDSKEAEGFGI